MDPARLRSLDNSGMLSGYTDSQIMDAFNSSSSVSGWSGFMHDLTGSSAADAFAASEAEKSRKFNAAEAQKARDFEERMSSTAYQRAASDMRAAGINPAMLAGISAHAGPASTPSGSGATSSSASSSGSAGGVIGAIVSGLVKIAVAAAS